jgi:hypothetical protein
MLRTSGSAKEPKLADAKLVATPAKGKGLPMKSYRRIDVTDWNNDGKLDLLVGISDGSKHNVWLFLGK